MKPFPKVTYEGKTLKRGTDYPLGYAANSKAGATKVTIKGRGSYVGT